MRAQTMQSFANWRYSWVLDMLAGVDMVHVPYRGGGPAVTDLIAGQVQVMFATTISSIEYIKAGKLRALAVTTATRWDALPDVPTIGEAFLDRCTPQ
jgi:tripartite-type tricarboxylate transporter receptor subunit TctC